MIRQVNLAKFRGNRGELTQEVNLSKVSWKNARLVNFGDFPS